MMLKLKSFANLFVLVVLLFFQFNSTFSLQDIPTDQDETYSLRLLPSPIQAINFPLDNKTFGCRVTYDGSLHSKYLISNPHGISGLKDYHIANFDQKVSNQTDTSITVDLTATIRFKTNTPYPPDPKQIPSEVNSFLQPAEYIQSNDPEIIALAKQLVSGAKTEVEAVDRIFIWVRSNIIYDFTFSLPTDAVSVFHNRSGVCDGYSKLSVALLRAAGIPSKTERGCVTQDGWGTDERGGWHAWINIYYLDAGWIASDPQSSENFVDTAHIFGGFDQCGETETTITRLIPAPGSDFTTIQDLFSYRLDQTHPYYIRAAYVVGLDGVSPQRYPEELTTSSITVFVTKENPNRIINLVANNYTCGGVMTWKVTTDSPWLIPLQNEGQIITTTDAVDSTGMIPVNLNATGLENGVYNGQIIYSDSYNNRSIPVKLLVADQIFSLNLPMINVGKD